MTKESIKGNISVSANTKIINDLANRVSTTELVNALNTMKTNGSTAANTTSTTEQQVAKLAIDNQAICTGVSSATSATCAFIINIHS
jgi:hypothetical protein